jgi:hypothetical protein
LEKSLLPRNFGGIDDLPDESSLWCLGDIKFFDKEVTAN